MPSSTPTSLSPLGPLQPCTHRQHLLHLGLGSGLHAGVDRLQDLVAVGGHLAGLRVGHALHRILDVGQQGGHKVGGIHRVVHQLRAAGGEGAQGRSGGWVRQQCSEASTPGVAEHTSMRWQSSAANCATPSAHTTDHLTLAMLRMITQALRRMGVVRSVRPRTSRGTRMDRVRPSTDCRQLGAEREACSVRGQGLRAGQGTRAGVLLCKRPVLHRCPTVQARILLKPPPPPAHLDEGGGRQLVHAVGHLAGGADAPDQMGHKGLNVAVANGSAALGERLGGSLAHSRLEVNHAVGHHRHNLGQVDLEGAGGVEWGRAAVRGGELSFESVSRGHMRGGPGARTWQAQPCIHCPRMPAQSV